MIWRKKCQLFRKNRDHVLYLVFFPHYVVFDLNIDELISRIFTKKWIDIIFANSTKFWITRKSVSVPFEYCSVKSKQNYLAMRCVCSKKRWFHGIFVQNQWEKIVNPNYPIYWFHEILFKLSWFLPHFYTSNSMGFANFFHKR